MFPSAIPYERHRFFFGREPLLSDLETLFALPLPLMIVGQVGMPGIGKTTMGMSTEAESEHQVVLMNRAEIHSAVPLQKKEDL